MGSLQAIEMAGLLARHTALRWHLQSNHFPPVHEVFIPVAERAIDLYNDEEYDTVIEMPNGISKTAGAICEELHLGPWLNDSWDDDYEEPDDDA